MVKKNKKEIPLEQAVNGIVQEIKPEKNAEPVREIPVEESVDAKLFEGELMIGSKRVINIVTNDFNGIKGLYEVKLEDGSTTTIEDKLIQTLKYE